MFPDPTQIKIFKDKLNTTKRDLERRNILLEDRGSIEERLETLEPLLQQHYKPPGEDVVTEITDLRQRRREIDHEIDQIDEDVEESVERMQQALVDSILIKHPEQRGEQERRAHAISERKAVLNELRLLEQSSRMVLEELQVALAIWEGRNQRGFWNRLFGKNPAIVASEHLERAREHTATVQKVLADFAEYTQRHPSVEKASPLFSGVEERLEAIRETPWSYGDLTESVDPYRRAVTALLQEIEREISDTREVLQTLGSEVEAWIDGLSKED